LRRTGPGQILREMPEKSLDPGRTIAADTDGVIRHWGGEVENVFGYTSEEALGRQVDLIIPPVLHGFHWRGFDKAIANGRLKRPNPNLKLPGIHKSGEIVPFPGDPCPHTRR
jgi:PAS domain S-box-containing protein